MLEVKFTWNVHGVMEETVPPSETLDMQAQELSEGELLDINDEGDYDKKDEDLPEEVTPAKHYIKRTLKYFTILKSQRIRCWESIQTKKGV